MLSLEAQKTLTGTKLRQDITKWLSPPDPSVNYNTACEAYHKDAAVWFTSPETALQRPESVRFLIADLRETHVSLPLPSFLLTEHPAP